jgi:hypothetical protein
LIIKRKDQIFTVKIIRVEAKEFRKWQTYILQYS